MDWQWKTKMCAHRRAEKVNSILGWHGCTPEVDGERYTGRVVVAPRAMDELIERAKHPQPPPLTADAIRTLLAAEKPCFGRGHINDEGGA
ncbi:MAG: hypothetical protein ACLQMH_10080 [Solirubrobacteraceae bacterium]